MGWITKWSFGNKAAISLVSILIFVLGVVSYFSLPMELLPQADTPEVKVVTVGNDIDSKTMESEVTTPIEQAMVGIKGKISVFSTTGDGFSEIDFIFESGTDMKQAKQDIQEALNTVPLPGYVSKPSVTQSNTSMIPTSFVAITFNDGVTQKNIDFAKEKLEPIYKEIKGVASVQTSGVEKSYVSVKIDNQKLDENNISLQSVVSVLRGQNVALSIGEKIINGKTSNIKAIGDLTSIEKLKDLTIDNKIKLGDLASIKVTKPENVISRFNGQDSIDMTIIKDSQSNVVTLSKEIEKVTKELNETYKNQKATVYLSTAEMVETSVFAMIKEVLLGALFATIVIMLFLRNIRSTLIAIVSIPLSLCLTVFLLSKSGVTLNLLTLGGVAVAVGRLVDDSIVVIENIFRKMQTEKFSVDMVIEATKEVGRAIIASTLTTIAVFLPIGLVSGSLREFLLPFALTVTYSLLASLLVAITVVPIMSAGLLKKTKLKEHTPPVRFTKLVSWSLNHKWIVLSLASLLFVGSISAYTMMPKGVAEPSKDYIQINLSYPNNTPIKEVTDKVLALEESIQKKNEVKYVNTLLGNSTSAAQSGAVGSPTEAKIRILLKDTNDIEKIVKEIEKEKSNYADAEFNVRAFSHMSGSVSNNITIDVVGDDIADLEAVTNDIKANIKDIDGVEKISTNQEEKKTIYSYVIDPEKGNTEETAQQLGILLNQTPIGTLNIDDTKTPIMLEPVLDTKTPEDLKDFNILTSTGNVPISKIATLKSEERSTNQFHKDGKTYLQVIATVTPSKLSEVNSKIYAVIMGDNGESKGINIPDNIEVFIGGANVQQSEDFTDLFTTMLVSIGLVFLIMVITFKGFRAPIAILCCLPLAVIGAVLGLMISKITVDVTALLGALMLIGIVVTNAIVLLDRVKQNEEKMNIREAIIEASSNRLRPILMTAVATICAMLPLLFKEAETGSLVSQSLAVVVIGGLTVGTLLTLVVIPCVYELFYFRKSKKQRLMNQNQEHQIVG